MPEDAGILEVGGLVALYGAFTAWRSSKNLADGLNSYNQSHQTPAQQQTDAQQGAQQGLSSSTTMGDCPGCGGPKCDDLYKKIESLTKDLAQRRGAMLADPLNMYDLYLKDPSAKVPDPKNPGSDLGNWEGHQQQLQQGQTQLNRQIKQYQNERCTGGLPTGAETQAGLDPPTKPFR